MPSRQITSRAMPKEILKDTATAVADKLLQSLMPTLNARLDAIEKQISDQRTDLERRFDKIDERFERIEVRFDKIDERFDKIDERFERMDLKFGELQRWISDRLERQTELINELGIRINSVSTKLDTWIDIWKGSNSDIQAFRERLVKVEEAQKRSRRAS